MTHDQPYESYHRNLIYDPATLKTGIEHTLKAGQVHPDCVNKPVVKYVSPHAKERVAQRSDRVKPNKLQQAVEHGRRVRARNPAKRIGTLCKHGPTEFYHYQDIVVVVANECIVTSYVYERDQWEPV